MLPAQNNYLVILSLAGSADVKTQFFVKVCGDLLTRANIIKFICNLYD